MSDQKKKIIFLSVFGGIVLILIIVLVIAILSGGKGKPVDVSDIQTGGRNISNVTTDQTEQVITEPQDTTENIPDRSQGGATTSRATKADNVTGKDQPQNTTTKQISNTTTRQTTNAPQGKTYNLLADPLFQNGFKVLGMNTADGGQVGSAVFNPLDSSGRQFWNIAQWGSRYSFNDSKYTTIQNLGNGVFKLKNTTKEFTVDTKTGKLTFTGLASKCYDTHRTGSEPWLHLLIEQTFKASDAKISELESVVVTLSNRLIMFEDHMGSAFNPNVHAAQFLMYFSIKNNDSNSPDYNKFIWFGFPMFDNRYEWINPSSMFDKGTQALMVGIGNRVLYESNNKNNCWKNGKINAGLNTEWSSFKLDVLPLIKNALNTAHKDGYLKNTSLEQLVIAGMNLGWEIPGTYDASMEMKDFSIMVTRK